MNALAWVGVPARLTLTAKSANVGRANSGRRLSFKQAQRRAITQSLYTRQSSRALFGFSFAPKQKEPAPTDGLSSYGMEKLRPQSEDNSDNFSKNPMFLKKADAKGEYGFNREVTNVGTKVNNTFTPLIFNSLLSSFWSDLSFPPLLLFRVQCVD